MKTSVASRWWNVLADELKRLHPICSSLWACLIDTFGYFGLTDVLKSPRTQFYTKKLERIFCE